jgi:hypothetical protein
LYAPNIIAERAPNFREIGGMLSLDVDKAAFARLSRQIIDRIEALGVIEAERRLGCSLDELLDSSRGILVDVVPAADDPLTMRIAPSVRFDEILAALA